MSGSTSHFPLVGVGLGKRGRLTVFRASEFRRPGGARTTPLVQEMGAECMSGLV